MEFLNSPQVVKGITMKKDAYFNLQNRDYDFFSLLFRRKV